MRINIFHARTSTGAHLGWAGGGFYETLRLHAMRAPTMELEETFRDLPSELWMNVLLQGGPALLSSCSRLCRQLHQAVSESSDSSAAVHTRALRCDGLRASRTHELA